MSATVVSLWPASLHIQTKPGIKGVVYVELTLRISQVVWKAQAETHGDSLKTGSQWIGVQPVGVRRVDDLRHSQERLVCQFVCLNDHIERAETVPVMQVAPGVSKGIAPSLSATSMPLLLGTNMN